MRNTNAKENISYEDIFTPGKTYANCMIKIKLIQEMIQIERPINWNMENIISIITSLQKIEQHNATDDSKKSSFFKNWSSYSTSIN
jgi:hypothetical protein